MGVYGRVTREPEEPRTHAALARAASLFPEECGGYGAPPRDGDAAERSFRLHADLRARRAREWEPGEEAKARVVSQYADHLPQVRCSLFERTYQQLQARGLGEDDIRDADTLQLIQWISSDPAFRAAFDDDLQDVARRAREQIAQLKPDSGPGYPFQSQYPDVAALRRGVGDDPLVVLVTERIALLALSYTYAATAREAVLNRLCGPVRVFIKSELHSQKKLEEGRLRLICSLDVVDRVVEMVLHDNLQSAEINSYTTIGPQPGMGATDAELERLAVRIHESRGDECRPWSSDVSGFDWSVPDWALDMEMALRRELVDANPVYWRACYARMACEATSLFVLPNGQLVEQLDRGMVKSGSFLTASRNSHIRGMLAMLRSETFGNDPAEAYFGDGFILPTTMGDDCVEVLAYTRFREDEDDSVDEVGKLALERQYADMGFSTTFDDETREVLVSSRDEGRRLTSYPGDCVGCRGGSCVYDVDVFTFCGYKFWQSPTGYAYEPDRWQKQLCTLLNTVPRSDADAAERVACLRYNLRHSPHRERAMQIIEASGWGKL